MKLSVAQLGRSLEITVLTLVMQPVVPLNVVPVTLMVALDADVPQAVWFEVLPLQLLVVVVVVDELLLVVSLLEPEEDAHDTSKNRVKIVSILAFIILCRFLYDKNRTLFSGRA